MKVEDAMPSCMTNLVTVKKDDSIISHLPGKIFQMCILFSNEQLLAMPAQVLKL